MAALDPARFIFNEAESTAQTVSAGASSEKPAEQEKQRNTTILPAVLSIGYNPFYKNEVKSIVRLNPRLPSLSLYIYSLCRL